jgi:hypothetical protein
MARLHRYLLPGLLALAVGFAGTGRAAAAPEATKDNIPLVTYEQLGDLIKKLRGKVVVVDFWNIY